jgi:hypothetical protein
MMRAISVCAVGVLLSILSVALPNAATAAGCLDTDFAIGACVGNGSIDIGAGTTRPGRDGNRGGGRDDSSHGSGDSGSGSDSGISPGGESCDASFRDCYTFGAPPSPEGPGSDAPAAPAVTIRDIASFAPNTPSLRTQPDRWAVVRLPLNVIATAAVHIREGTLLGQLAEVRFTPIAYSFDYGDGTTNTVTDGGAGWVELGLREFSETPTSHTFGTAGRYMVTVSVDYAAEFRHGGSPWTAVSGSLTIPTDTPLQVSVREAKTVLVDRDCRHPRRGPGC